jgi:hypothetical protein
LENLSGNDQTTNFDPTTLGFPASLVSQFSRPQYPQISMGTYQAQGAGPSVQGDDTYTLAASGGKVIATHVMKFGVELREFRTTNLNFGPAGGSFGFTKLWTQADPNRADALSGNEIASALLGYPTTGSLTLPITPAYRSKYYSFFFQDDWKITRKLTLNLGLRWDYESPVAERYNQMTRGFALGQASPIAAQVSGRPGVENCAACKGLTGGLVVCGEGRGRAVCVRAGPEQFPAADRGGVFVEFEDGAAWRVRNLYVGTVGTGRGDGVQPDDAGDHDGGWIDADGDDVEPVSGRDFEAGGVVVGIGDGLGIGRECGL